MKVYITLYFPGLLGKQVAEVAYSLSFLPETLSPHAMSRQLSSKSPKEP